MNATKVSNKEHEVTMELDSQVQPLPCKVAAEKKAGDYKEGDEANWRLAFSKQLKCGLCCCCHRSN